MLTDGIILPPGDGDQGTRIGADRAPVAVGTQRGVRRRREAEGPVERIAVARRIQVEPPGAGVVLEPVEQSHEAGAGVPSAAVLRKGADLRGVPAHAGRVRRRRGRMLEHPERTGHDALARDIGDERRHLVDAAELAAEPGGGSGVRGGTADEGGQRSILRILATGTPPQARGEAPVAPPAPRPVRSPRVARHPPGMTASAAAPTDADLLETVSSLVGPAARVQLWLFPLDADGVPLRVVVPIEDVPLEAAVMPRLAASITEMAELSGWAALVLVWERPGPAWLAPREECVVAAFRAATGLPVRAEFLSHDGGVTRLASGTAA
jgi:hypothetical protein